MSEEQKEGMSKEKLEKISSEHLSVKKYFKGSWQQIIEIAFIVILLFTVIGMNHAISNMKIQMDQVQADMSNLQNSVSNEISAQIEGITSSIDTSLRKSESIVADYSYRVESDKIDRKNRTVPIMLTIRPKEDKTGLSATFLIETEDGKILTVPAQKSDAYTYRATASVPIKDYLKLGVTFYDGATQKSEKLEDLYQPFDSMIMKVDSLMSSYGVTQTMDKIIYTGTAETTITQSADGKNYPVKASIQFFKNGKLKTSIPIEIEDISSNSQQAPSEAVAMAGMMGSTTTYCTQINEELKRKSDSVIEVRVVVEDNYGFKYTQIIDNESIDKDGGSNTNNYSGAVVIE